jgi:hypothetical protein
VKEGIYKSRPCFRQEGIAIKHLPTTSTFSCTGDARKASVSFRQNQGCRGNEEVRKYVSAAMAHEQHADALASVVTTNDGDVP